jgi:hypothetical protein
VLQPGALYLPTCDKTPVSLLRTHASLLQHLDARPYTPNTNTDPPTPTRPPVMTRPCPCSAHLTHCLHPHPPGAGLRLHLRTGHGSGKEQPAGAEGDVAAILSHTNNDALSWGLDLRLQQHMLPQVCHWPPKQHPTQPSNCMVHACSLTTQPAQAPPGCLS